MRMLELFSGSGDVSAHFRSKGYETLTLDNRKRMKPTLCVDILKWNYKELPPHHFDFIWASPDCTSWTKATHIHRTLKEGLRPKTKVAELGEELVHKTLEIIDYFKPDKYVIENPRGRMRYFPPIAALPYRSTVYYCNYDHYICKPTDLFTNFPLWKEVYKLDAPLRWDDVHSKQRNRNQIPVKLIQKIFNYMKY
jgi:hypothetical protein